MKVASEHLQMKMRLARDKSMKVLRILKLKILILTGIFTSLLVGCSSIPHYDVEIYPSAELVTQFGYMPSLEVDVSGITENEASRIKAVNVDLYFTAGNALRKTLKPETLKFSEDDVSFKEVDDDAACWAIWSSKGADHLAVVVNLPLAEDSSSEDGRKIVIPIVSDSWFSRNSGTLRFEITPSGLIQINKVPEVQLPTSVDNAEPVLPETMTKVEKAE